MQKRTHNIKLRLGIALVLVASAALYALSPAGNAADTPAKPQETLDLPTMPAQDTSAQKPQLAPAATAPTPSNIQPVPITPTGTPAAPAAQPAPVPSAPIAVTPIPSDTPLQLLQQSPAVPGNAPVAPPPSPSHAVPTVPPQNAAPVVVTPIAPAPVSPGAVSAADASKPPVPVDTPPPPPPEENYNTTLSLMFTDDDMAIVAKMFKTYDSYDEHKAAEPQKDNLADLFHNEEPTPQQQVQQTELPNLFLGSIVYNSPKNWIITINGRHISPERNSPGSEIYITRISRREVEFIWKPHSLNDIPDKWNQATDGGKKSIAGIVVDATTGTIKLNMHPNQTFVTNKLEIREGLIKPDESFFEQIKQAVETIATPKQDAPK